MGAIRCRWGSRDIQVATISAVVQAGKIEHVPVSPLRVNTVARPMSAAMDQRYRVVALQT
jgi:hypothetical protein